MSTQTMGFTKEIHESPTEFHDDGTVTLTFSIMEGNGIQTLSDYMNDIQQLREKYGEWFATEMRDEILDYVRDRLPVDADEVPPIGHKMHLPVATVTIDENAEVVEADIFDRGAILQEAEKMNTRNTK